MMRHFIECPCCRLQIECKIETEITGLRDWQDVEVQSAVRPIIALAPDDSDLYQRGVLAGRRQSHDEAIESHWRGER